MSGRAILGLAAAGLALAATPAKAYDYQDLPYASGYTVASSRAYSRSVQVQQYGADYAGRPIDYAPGDEPTAFYPQSSAYQARYDEGYVRGAAYEDRYEARYHDAGHRQTDYGHRSSAHCPPMGPQRVVRCVYRPIREEISVDAGIFDGGVGVIPSGGGGGFVIIGGGMASGGARAYASASASASASVTVRGGGRYKGGGCHSCGGKNGHSGKGH